MIQAISFYAFAAVTVAAVMVISARNPVHSVLFLILAFSMQRDYLYRWAPNSSR